MNRFAGRTAIITGYTRGIGASTARRLAGEGANLVLVARSGSELDLPGENAVVKGDVADASTAEEAVRVALGRFGRLDVLVNNAGITIRRREETPEGHDVMLAVNHLGPFLLTDLLLPLLRASAPARIVNLASEAHKFGKLRLDDLEATRGYGFMGFPRYAETKLMNILATREQARRLAGTGVTANCVHPGGVRTNLGAPPALVGSLVGLFLKSPEVGARTSLAAATDPAYAELTGTYFAKSKPADSKLSKQANDDDLAARLWEASEQLLGLA